MSDRQVPLGEPLDFTDDELEELAEVTDQDVLEAHQYTITALSDLFKNLPLTQPEVDDAEFAEDG